MTPPKRWPNEAERARSEAISQANKILRLMAPMKDALDENKPVSSYELSIRLMRMSDATNVIIKELTAFSPRKFSE